MSAQQKVRIREVAKEVGRSNKELLEKAKEFGLDPKTASSSITIEQAEQLIQYIANGLLEKTNPKSISTQKEISQSKQPTITDKQENQDQSITAVSPKQLQDEPKIHDDHQNAPKASISVVARNEKIEKKPDIQEAKEQEIKIPKTTSVQITNSIQPLSTQTQDTTAQTENAPDKSTLVQAISDSIPKKRTGLRIVKKRHEDTLKKEEDSASQQINSTQQSVQSIVMASVKDDNKSKKKRVEKKKNVLQAHKKGGQRLDLLKNRTFEHFGGYDEDEEELILFDLSVRDNSFEEEEQEFERAQKPKKENHRPHGSFKEKEKREQKIIHRPPAPPPAPKDDTVKISEGIRAYEFADKVGCTLSAVIKILFNLGIMVTKNDFLDKDAIEILAEELCVKVLVESDTEALEYVQEEEQDNPEDLSIRPPVVTIMGHVDHGKTSLLDKIRNTKVAAGEAGGITQHIGAYMITKDDKAISFIDTPGHEAFTEMRARGAGVTDIVIIVIAADDGIKQQTIEALDHAKAANVPIIIAVNKIDKEEANPDKVKAEAAELGYTPVEWGGDYEFIHISAKTGEGIDVLLETILIQAEILELKANPNATARAVVIESSLEKGKGPVATVIIKNGTLRMGESIVADTAFGRVRALINDEGKNIQSIGPSEVAVVIGLSEVPTAGAILMSVQNDSTAREYAEKRASYLRQKEFSRSTKVSLDELSAMVAEGQLKSLPVIIKTDTQGSLEAIKGSLEKVRNDEVKVNIIHSGVGGITESDVLLAQTSNHGIILGFNVRPTGIVKNRAKELGVEIKTYSIIYDLINEIKSVLSGMMTPTIEEESTGQAEVRETFKIPKIGTVAGCFVSDGVIQRGIKARVIRDGVVIYNGSIASLKRFKDDAREVAKGFECGIMIDGFNDLHAHDVIETYKEIEKNKSL